MTPFKYSLAESADAAVQMVQTSSRSTYLGGGTNLVDLMRERVVHASALVDVSKLSSAIEIKADGSIVIGAAATNTAVAAHLAVRERFPVLARALLAGASGQIRNMATVGGNLLQRTRCMYFYDGASRCNKRRPGDGCDAIEGFNRMHAILGASPSCVATHPSDMCVALVALDAMVHLEGLDGKRSIKLVDLHRLPGDRPDHETDLLPHELITAVEIPSLEFAKTSVYHKVRDRSSYAFALISVAAAIDVDSGGIVRDVRLAMGGVAHKPWRAWKAESFLRDKQCSTQNFHAAADAELIDAIGLRDNTFKIELAKRGIISVLSELSGVIG
jgi:xanthine dehydrogenase YagS FAD-binding subunit